MGRAVTKEDTERHIGWKGDSEVESGEPARRKEMETSEIDNKVMEDQVGWRSLQPKAFGMEICLPRFTYKEYKYHTR